MAVASACELKRLHQGPNEVVIWVRAESEGTKVIQIVPGSPVTRLRSDALAKMRPSSTVRSPSPSFLVLHMRWFHRRRHSCSVCEEFCMQYESICLH